MTEVTEFFESLRWRGVVVIVAGIAGFVALGFAPPACSLRVTSTPTTTTVDEYPVCEWSEEIGGFVSPENSNRPCVVGP